MRGLREVVVINLALLFVAGCGLSDKERARLLIQAKENGVMINSNGMASDECEKMTKQEAEELGMAHVSARKDILDILRAGMDSRYGNNHVYHSWGSIEAEEYAKWCADKGVQIRGEYAIGGYISSEFGRNVDQVYNFISSIPWVFGEKKSKGGRNPPKNRVIKGHHLEAPWKAKPHIKQYLLNGARRRVRR